MDRTAPTAQAVAFTTVSLQWDVPSPGFPDAAQSRRSGSIAAAIALSGAVFAWLAGLHGVDLAAQQYNLHVFREFGWTLWDAGWYGGHSVLAYSVLLPAVASALGLYFTGVVSAGVAAWAFDRLLVTHLGRSARAGSIVFAAGTIVPVIVGQLPFLMGEALGLVALVAVVRRYRWCAAVCALACTLASPVAGLFLLIALAATGWTSRVHRPIVIPVAAAAALPMAATALLFGSPGYFPLPWRQLAAIVVAGSAFLVFFPRAAKSLRVGVVLYLAATIVAFVVPNPVGGNIGRLVMNFGAAIVIGMAVSHRRVTWGLLALPLVVWQLAPLTNGTVHRGAQTATTSAYFAPLIVRLRALTPDDRIEIPPLRSHEEAALVASSVPIARGWERQQDIARNPIFYRGGGFGPAEYRRWLNASGITYVALADAPLDPTAKVEADVIRSRPAFLHEVWHDAHWQLFAVAGSPGMVTGPVRITSVRPDHVALQAHAAGTALLRLQYNSHWVVESDNACVAPSSAGWTSLRIEKPGRIDLVVALLGHDGGSECRAP